MPDPPLYTPDDPDPDPVTTGPAAAPLVMTGGVGTMFGDAGDRRRYFAAKARGASEQQALSVGDPGIGAGSLGTVNTAQAYGVAVPEDWLRKTFGDDQSNWRKARVQLKFGDKVITVPIVDIGPGKTARSRGVVSDMTDMLWKGLGVEGDNPQVTVKLLPNYGPDYQSDRQAWNQEQQQIAQALSIPLALGSPAPTPTAAYAQGGIVTKPTVALVGESGPEAIVPLAQGNFPNIRGLMNSPQQGRGQQRAGPIHAEPDDISSIQQWLSTATL